jgi:hypothetical protein
MKPEDIEVGKKYININDDSPVVYLGVYLASRTKKLSIIKCDTFPSIVASYVREPDQSDMSNFWLGFRLHEDNKTITKVFVRLDRHQSIRDGDFVSDNDGVTLKLIVNLPDIHPGDEPNHFKSGKSFWRLFQ